MDGKYNVSFSGLKTAVLNEVNKAQMKNEEINVPDLAASFQERIAGILAEKLLLAAADAMRLAGVDAEEALTFAAKRFTQRLEADET